MLELEGIKPEQWLLNVSSLKPRGWNAYEEPGV